MKHKTFLFIIGALLIISVLVLGSYFIMKSKFDLSNNQNVIIKPNKTSNFDFDYYVTKELYKSSNNDNFMVSPLSIAFSLKMISDGATGNTLKEINDVINNYRLTYPNGIKNHLIMANSIFINEKLKSGIDEDYISALRINYLSDVIYDEFESTENINKWVAEKTMNMIPNFLSDITPDKPMVLINALAMNFDWKDKFECSKTTKGIFHNNGIDIDVYMMDGYADYYYEDDDSYAFIKEYAKYDEKGNITDKKGISFEMLGIMPKGDLNSYFNSFDYKKFKNILDNKKQDDGIVYNLIFPRFEFDYKDENIKKSLINLGIKDAFNENAKFTKISKNNEISIDNIIQKTFISVNEKGTKAAAATGTIFKNTTAVLDNEKKIVFDKPFIFIIKEKNTDNIWFYGVVNNPIEFDETKDICVEEE